MDWQEQLIGLYLEICELYDQELCLLTERMSNNHHPNFTDVELASWSLLLNEPKPIRLSLYFNGPIIPWSQRCDNPLNLYFNWVEATVKIEDASKARSTKGLKVHVWGRLAVAILVFAQMI